MLRIAGFGLLLAGCTGVATTPVNDHQNRVVDIVNPTDMPAQFYALNAERRGINRPRFAEGEVAPRHYLIRNFEDGSGACLFDLHAEFEDGQHIEARRFNTCKAASWVIRP